MNTTRIIGETSLLVAHRNLNGSLVGFEHLELGTGHPHFAQGGRQGICILGPKDADTIVIAADAATGLTVAVVPGGSARIVAGPLMKSEVEALRLICRDRHVSIAVARVTAPATVRWLSDLVPGARVIRLDVDAMTRSAEMAGKEPVGRDEFPTPLNNQRPTQRRWGHRTRKSMPSPPLPEVASHGKVRSGTQGAFGLPQLRQSAFQPDHHAMDLGAGLGRQGRSGGALRCARSLDPLGIAAPPRTPSRGRQSQSSLRQRPGRVPRAETARHCRTASKCAALLIPLPCRLGCAVSAHSALQRSSSQRFSASRSGLDTAGGRRARDVTLGIAARGEMICELEGGMSYDREGGISARW